MREHRHGRVTKQAARPPVDPHKTDSLGTPRVQDQTESYTFNLFDLTFDA